MIGEFLLNIIFNIVEGFLSIVPVEWTADTTFFEYVRDILDIVTYMLPWKHVVTIISLIMSVTLFRCAVAFARTIWDILPFV